MHEEFGWGDTPTSVIIACLHHKGIFPGRQVGVGDISLWAALACIYPVLVKSFQFVGKQIPLAGEIVDNREMDTEQFPVGRKGHP